MLPNCLPRLIKTIRTNDGHGEEVIGRAEPAGWDIALLGICGLLVCLVHICMYVCGLFFVLFLVLYWIVVVFIMVWWDLSEVK